MIGLRKKIKTPLKIGLQKKRETRVEKKKKDSPQIKRERERETPVRQLLNYRKLQKLNIS